MSAVLVTCSFKVNFTFGSIKVNERRTRGRLREVEVRVGGRSRLGRTVYGYGCEVRGGRVNRRNGDRI